MNDYIKREDAINEARAYDDNDRSLLDALEDIPSADVVEVVRCKDCKHAPSYNIYGSLYCLKHNDAAVDENDYCSDGERADT